MEDNRTEYDKKNDATHEAGHAIVNHRLCVHVIRCHNLLSDTGSGGQTVSNGHCRPDHLDDVQDYIDGICICLAGPVAQEMVFRIRPPFWKTPFDTDRRTFKEYCDRLGELRLDLDLDSVEATVKEMLKVWMSGEEQRRLLDWIAEDVYTPRSLEAGYFDKLNRVEYVPIVTVDDLPKKSR